MRTRDKTVATLYVALCAVGFFSVVLVHKLHESRISAQACADTSRSSVQFKNGPTDIRIFKNAGLLI